MRPTNAALARRITTLRALVVASLAAWIVGFVAPSIWLGAAALAPVLSFPYGVVCHQDPAKLLVIAGEPTLVCARCAGIYLGAFLASAFALALGARFRKPRESLVFAVVAFLAADAFGATLGAYDYSKPLAIATGAAFGAVVGAYVLAAIEEAALAFRRDETGARDDSSVCSLGKKE
ncbi:MAG: DUF2085 domain-containing protein [Ignavibacteriales bacterium]|nr:DUF2085 domain-containing protein [Ignavibacteriales bacterium]